MLVTPGIILLVKYTNLSIMNIFKIRKIIKSTTNKFLSVNMGVKCTIMGLNQI